MIFRTWQLLISAIKHGNIWCMKINNTTNILWKYSIHVLERYRGIELKNFYRSQRCPRAYSVSWKHIWQGGHSLKKSWGNKFAQKKCIPCLIVFGPLVQSNHNSRTGEEEANPSVCGVTVRATFCGPVGLWCDRASHICLVRSVCAFVVPSLSRPHVTHVGL